MGDARRLGWRVSASGVHFHLLMLRLLSPTCNPNVDGTYIGCQRVSHGHQMKKQSTIGIEETLIPEIKKEGEKIGLGWTSMVEILVREALAARKAKAS